MRPWWEVFPEVLEAEYDAFKAHGIAYKVNEEQQAQGVLELELEFPGPEGAIPLLAAYPELYPYFKPEVSTEALRLQRHQHPLGGNLCLLGRRTSHWYSSETLADVLWQQIPRLLKFQHSTDAAALGIEEERQGEPASEYYNGASVPGSYILFDGGWSVDPAAKSGRMKALVKEVSVETGNVGLQGLITEVNDGQNMLATWDGPRPAGYRNVEAPWLRMAQPVVGGMKQIMAALSEKERAYLVDESRLPHGKAVVLSGLLFSEEVQHRKFKDGWAFVVIRAGAKKRGKARDIKLGFLRAARAGAGDLTARMPGIEALASKSVALFGLGALGSPIAIELARAGVSKLTLVDHDIVDPATVRRWALGWPTFAKRKTEALREHIEQQFPWTEVDILNEKIGATHRNVAEEGYQADLLEQVVAKSDVVVDVTAELGVNHYLSDICAEQTRPYILANATPGAWGGMVAQFRPGKGRACWVCFREALYGKSASLALPPADPEGELQPPGCADSTFTGSSFDLQEICLETVRTSVGLLAPDYAEAEWDVSMLATRDKNGKRTSPCWTEKPVPKRKGCTCDEVGQKSG